MLQNLPRALLSPFAATPCTRCNTCPRLYVPCSHKYHAQNRPPYPGTCCTTNMSPPSTSLLIFNPSVWIDACDLGDETDPTACRPLLPLPASTAKPARFSKACSPSNQASAMQRHAADLQTCGTRAATDRAAAWHARVKGRSVTDSFRGTMDSKG